MGVYLLGCLLDEGVLMHPEADEQPQKAVDEVEVEGVGNAFGFYHEQTLKRMYYFLNLLPLVCVFLNPDQIPLDYLVYSFVLFYEYQQQVVGCLPDLGLGEGMHTF